MVGAGLYLRQHGLPLQIREVFHHTLARHGVRIHLQKIRILSPSRIALDKVTYYNTTSPKLPPIFTADTVLLDLHYRALFRKKEPILQKITIVNGRYRAPHIAPALDVDNITAEINRHKGGLTVDRFTAKFHTADIKVQGSILLPPLETPWRDQWLALYNIPPKNHFILSQFLSNVRVIESDESSTIDINFYLDPLYISSNFCAVVVEAKNFSVNGQHFTSGRFEGRLNGPLVNIPELTLRREIGVFHGHADHNIPKHSASINIFNTLPQEAVTCFIPTNYINWLDRRQVNISGTTEGTFNLQRILSDNLTVQGRISCDNLIIADTITCTNVTAKLLYANKELIIEDIKSQVPTGRLEFQGLWRQRLKSFQGHIHTKFNPNILQPYMSSNQANYFQAFAFNPATPPQSDLYIQVKRTGTNHTTFLRGTIASTNFLSHGENFDTLNSSMTYSNGVLWLRQLSLKRADNLLAGTIGLDFDNHTADIDIFNSIDPKIAAKLIGPGAEQIVAPFTFQGQTVMTITGRVDYTKRQNMDFYAHVWADKIILFNWPAEKCTFDLFGQNDNYHIPNIRGQIYDGHLLANLLVYPNDIGLSSNLAYKLDAQVDRISITNILTQQGVTITNFNNNGRVDFTAKIQGVISTQWQEKIIAEGTINVRDADLLKIRLFGPFTTFLSGISPGLGSAQQTEFSSNFRIEEQKVYLENARLRGNLININANGSCTFDQKLDFKVHVRLFGDDPASRIFNVIFYPVYRTFLDFHVGGTLKDPDWESQVPLIN